MKQQKKKKKLISWILLLSWMVFIFYMSQQTGQVSSGQSGKIVLLLSKIGIEISQDNISKITFIIRKSAHFSEYFVLYILLFISNVSSLANKCFICLSVSPKLILKINPSPLFG